MLHYPMRVYCVAPTGRKPHCVYALLWSVLRCSVSLFPASSVNAYLRTQGFDSSESDVQFLVSIDDDKRHVINGNVKAVKKGT